MEYSSHDWGQNQASKSSISAQLHGLLPFSRACEDAGHYEDDVCRGGDEVDLEHKIPPSVPVAKGRHVEEVDVSRTEDDDIEDLG